jgi:hypothetical protein
VLNKISPTTDDDKYPSVPRPTIVLVKEGVLTYPELPNPCTVLGRKKLGLLGRFELNVPKVDTISPCILLN